MVAGNRLSRRLVGLALLAAAMGAIGFGAAAVVTPAHAQFFSNDQDYRARRARPQQQHWGGNFFENLFGPFEQRPNYQNERPQPRERHQPPPPQPADNSHAPPPRKADAKAEPPTTSIVVMGDGMADWLAYGLEDAFSDTPEVGIVRKDKAHSGLLHYEAKGDLDWWHVARDILAQEKADYVVMMLGVTDRQNIREKDIAKDDADKTPDAADKKDEKAAPDQPENAESAPEPSRSRKSNGLVEFRSDEWAKIYSRRIDETIAALKSKGVPVFWVGLPSIRGTRSTADASYLNDLFRARAERAGIVYIDVWDGFVDEGGKFTTFGPDYEGQVRRLRSADGVFFTKYGARKLAHYVERVLRRYMTNRATVALPSGPIPAAPSEGKPSARPLAGPVVPLTALPANTDVLLGGGGSSTANAGDAVATQVLVKGEPLAPPPGRADDFAWPRGSDSKTPVAAAPATSPPTATAAIAPAAEPLPPPAAAAESKPPAKPLEAVPKPKESPKTAQNRPKRPPAVRTRPTVHSNAPRPPRPVGPNNNGNNFFGAFFR